MALTVAHAPSVVSIILYETISLQHNIGLNILFITSVWARKQEIFLLLWCLIQVFEGNGKAMGFLTFLKISPWLHTVQCLQRRLCLPNWPEWMLIDSCDSWQVSTPLYHFSFLFLNTFEKFLKQNQIPHLTNKITTLTVIDVNRFTKCRVQWYKHTWKTHYVLIQPLLLGLTHLFKMQQQTRQLF